MLLKMHRSFLSKILGCCAVNLVLFLLFSGSFLSTIFMTEALKALDLLRKDARGISRDNREVPKAIRDAAESASLVPFDSVMHLMPV